jgi:thymidylate synthase (FAD)
MKVKTLAHTPEPEKLIAAAAKLCYSSSPVDKIMDELTDEAVEKFLTKLVDMGHESPLEHAIFTFGIDGVSRALSHQLVRHRIASYSQKSQRYVNECEFDYVIPPEIDKDEVEREIFDDTIYVINEAYQQLVIKLQKRGRTKEQSQEDARYLLPNACTTSIVVTMNVRILLHFFNKRCCNRAQWEIREMAEQMLSQCKQIAPILFKNAGAPCIAGDCSEGSMTCGEPK